MTTRTAGTSREIDGQGRTVLELLGGRKYSIDYYQRECKWLWNLDRLENEVTS